MAKNQALCNHVEDDYIDLEVSSSSKFLCYSINSPPHSREFEFQMCSVSHDRESTTTPADDLFYKGKLLPLHLPPRLLMVQKLTTSEKKTQDSSEESCVIPFVTSSGTTTTNTSTPLESCNVSPSESSRVSSEINSDEYFFDWSTEMSGFIDGDQSKKSWNRKLKLIKKSSMGQKLKASRAYLMSLFGKSGCSDEFCAKAACDVEPENISKGNTCLSKSPFGKIGNDRYKIPTTFSKNIKKEMVEDGANNVHRRSFSGAIQRHSAMKCLSSSTSTSSSGSSSSSSFSFSSLRFYDLQLLKRSSSANSEIENSIEGAIAHCKQSQQLFTSRKNSK
ncbi:probable membrane-associated kinase regulator 4 [Pistacia vera]|uniref:probable membrane-associated kinase regulator 4 n=1 Tax=Pistacia vera TaxID=55513 RepID=UPI0012633662|nr:probable membrane-associated kinase regulator 4 [Pistacia vera]